MLICIDGVDSSGKNTQSKLLADRLSARLYSFPRYDTPLGALIKRHLTSQTRLLEEVPSNTTVVRPQRDGSVTVVGGGFRVDAADPLMFQCLATIDKYDAANDIRADLADGKHVVCDRYTQSALAYGQADGLDVEWLRRIQSSLPVPDLNIFIDVSEEEALKRRPQLRDRYEKDREKQRRVQEIYRELWHSGGPGWVVVDGHDTVENVHDVIYGAVATALVRSRGKR